MNFREFERTAQEIFESIPEEFREGIDGLEITRATVPHPTLPEIFTLGECKTESYPGGFGGPGDVRSIIALYYGSFLAVSRTDEDWDWEEEIYETITHEIQHHRESLALEEDLEEFDYAQDQNFARREGERFDPFYYRLGAPVGRGAWEIDGDVFVEVKVGRREAQAGGVEVHHEGRSYRVALDPLPADVHFVRLDELNDPPGDLFAVLVRSRGLGEWLAAAFRGKRLDVRQSDLLEAADESGREPPP